MQEKRDYVNGVEYKGGVLDRFAHSEGAVVNQAGSYVHEYNIKDHLGNTRVTYSDANNDGVLVVSDMKQINHFYPFGLNMEGNWNGASGSNKYQYNGKEWNDDFGLGWNDYGARWYDPSVSRWGSVDPMAEKFLSHTPYNYVMNRPTIMIDPNGMEAYQIDGGVRFTGQNAINAFNYLKMRIGSKDENKGVDKGKEDQTDKNNFCKMSMCSFNFDENAKSDVSNIELKWAKTNKTISSIEVKFNILIQGIAKAEGQKKGRDITWQFSPEGWQKLSVEAANSAIEETIIHFAGFTQTEINRDAPAYFAASMEYNLRKNFRIPDGIAYFEYGDIKVTTSANRNGPQAVMLCPYLKAYLLGKPIYAMPEDPCK